MTSKELSGTRTAISSVAVARGCSMASAGSWRSPASPAIHPTSAGTTVVEQVRQRDQHAW
jgi:hypothetical protein